MQAAERRRGSFRRVVEWFSTPPVSGNWFYRFILYPILQILIFIIGITFVLTLLAYLLALLVPKPNPALDIYLTDQISKQLPGMIISGMSVGFVYAMIALGYTLVYGVLKFINFAHSEIFMFGSVIGFEVISRLNDAILIPYLAPVAFVVLAFGAPLFISGGLARLFKRQSSLAGHESA